MSIEEERKAFERYYSRNHGTPLDVLRTLRLGETYSIKANDNVRRAWESWLAAKAHAAEMAKPVPKLDVILWIADDNGDDIDRFYVYQPGWKSPEFLTESEAIQWANDNGYRVIEE